MDVIPINLILSKQHKSNITLTAGLSKYGNKKFIAMNIELFETPTACINYLVYVCDPNMYQTIEQKIFTELKSAVEFYNTI